MTAAVIANLQKLIGTPRDGALLRFSLGNEYLKIGDAHNARLQLAEAVARDPAYSAAWKLLGKALAEIGEPQAALDAYRQGIAAAEKARPRDDAPARPPPLLGGELDHVGLETGQLGGVVPRGQPRDHDGVRRHGRRRPPRWSRQ